MKHRPAFVPLILVLLVTSSLAPGRAAHAVSRAPAPAAVAAQVPPVPNAQALRAKYQGQTITFVSDNAIGSSGKRDQLLAAQFTRDTGITVKLAPHPAASGAAYTQLARNFATQSPAFDVLMLDAVWPGAFAPYLVDLLPALRADAALHNPSIIQNDTVEGRLVAMPWFGDFGILYYRSDLLKKYGYSHPPRTWAELGTMAAKIQAGERSTNKNFYGYVFQGSAYEGLTCNVLEWLYSSGAGGVIDNGKVTIDNPTAVSTLTMIQHWIGTITPPDVTTYQEEQARTVFDAGNAAFMRNWPYAYSAGMNSAAVKGKFDVTTLPAVSGHAPVGTVGGWQVGVSKYSKHIPAAIELVRYLTSPAVEKFDALFNSNVPTILTVAMDPQVRAANPYLKPQIAGMVRVARPSTILGAHYQDGSYAIYQGIHQILLGQDAQTMLARIAGTLQRLLAG